MKSGRPLRLQNKLDCHAYCCPAGGAEGPYRGFKKKKEKRKREAQCLEMPSIYPSVQPSIFLKGNRGAGSHAGKARAAKGDLGPLVTGLTHLDKQPSALGLRIATVLSEQPGRRTAGVFSPRGSSSVQENLQELFISSSIDAIFTRYSFPLFGWRKMSRRDKPTATFGCN